MRGKLAVLAAGRPHLRIIPAHAGQTNTCLSRRPDRSDHPRACGANSSMPASPTLTIGSSPRMRGKRTLTRRTRDASCGTDHPRACGANLFCGQPTVLPIGSSPRMRGKPRLRLRRLSMGRIIPAHAGQTPSSRRTCCCRSDHPRACGANGRDAPGCVQESGSSPRMRGKRFRPWRRRSVSRIIPAHAGQTNRNRGTRLEYPDHPRACGANLP